jgi:hypothetical protein
VAQSESSSAGPVIGESDAESDVLSDLGRDISLSTTHLFQIALLVHLDKEKERWSG